MNFALVIMMASVSLMALLHCTHANYEPYIENYGGNAYDRNLNNNRNRDLNANANANKDENQSRNRNNVKSKNAVEDAIHVCL